jgi:hypothetical protein
MSLFPTDEDNARSEGYYRGKRDGRTDTITELEDWMKNDCGMSIREKLKTMRGKQ